MNIYKIWIGLNPLPDHFTRYTDTWSRISDAEIIDIGNEYIEQVKYSPAVQWAIKNNNWAVLNHYIRYHLLYNNGGIYLDLDVEVIKDLPYSMTHGAHIGMELPNWANNHVMIANYSGIPFFKYCMIAMDAMAYDQMQEVELNTGPRLVTRILQQFGFVPRELICIIQIPHESITIHPECVFSPHRWNQTYHQDEIKPDTIAVHHFAHSWKPV